MPARSAGSVTRLALYGGARPNYDASLYANKVEQEAPVTGEQGGGSGPSVYIGPRRPTAVDLRTEEHLAVFLAAIAVCIDDNS